MGELEKLERGTKVLKNKPLYERAHSEFEEAKKVVGKDGKRTLFDLRNQSFDLYRQYQELTTPQTVRA